MLKQCSVLHITLCKENSIQPKMTLKKRRLSFGYRLSVVDFISCESEENIFLGALSDLGCFKVEMFSFNSFHPPTHTQILS